MQQAPSMGRSSVAGPGTVQAGPRLDRLPIGRFHWRMFFLISLGAFFDAFDLFLAAGILGSFVKSGFATILQNAAFVSLTFAGMVIGAWMAGLLGDRFGRRFTYQFNLALFGLASIGAAFAPDMTVLTVLRFIMGIGLGAELVTCSPALAEFVPPTYRGRWLAFMQAVANLAAPAAGLLGYIVIPTIGWRYMFVFAGAGALLLWAARSKMPESPRWLESKGRLAEADRVLRQIEAGYPGALPAVQPTAGPAPGDMPLGTIFRPPLLWRTLVGTLIHVTTGFVIFGFFNWVPTFFVRQGVEVTSSLAWSALMLLGAPVGALLGTAVADRYRRKPSIVAACLSAALFGAIYPFVGHGPQLILVGFCLAMSAYVLVSLAFGLYVSEMFPTGCRLRGVGTCGTAGRIATAVVQYPILWLFAMGGVAAVAGVLVGLLLLLALVITLFGVETQHRPLEAISAS